MKENYDNLGHTEVDVEFKNEIENKFQELLGRLPSIEEVLFLQGRWKDGYTIAEIEEEFIKSLDEYKKPQEREFEK